MGYLGRRIGLSQDQGDSRPAGADGAVGGGILDLFASGYFQREGNIYNAPGEPVSGLTATGGVISDYLDPSPGKVYRAHVFTSSGTFNVTATGSFGDTVEYLVVAGGGGGGGSESGDLGGGGGAGGLRTNLSGHPLAGSAFPVSTSPGSYTVTVGAGGASEPPGAVPGGKSILAGQRGNPSVFGPITSTGGGAGGAVYSSYGQSGGSGGGAGIQYSSNGSLIPASTGTGNTPSVSPSQGNPGGGSRHNPGSSAGTGGGGGAGGAGGDAPASTVGGTGGIGVQVLIAGPPASDQPVGTPGPASGKGWFSGGGGGSTGTTPSSNAGVGGSGGGGNGVAGTGAGTNGTVSTGGGGGSSRTDKSGLGGSGIVVVRYQIGSVAAEKATGGNVSYYNNKTIHTFLTSGTFATTSDWSAADVEYLVVGGGGAGGTGGGYGGGGGGAGGFKTGTTPIGAHPVSTTIQVGAGGGGAASANKGSGLDGTPSYFGTPITSTGGGGGGYDEGPYSTEGRPGGSGGGNGGGPQGQGGPNAGSPPQGYPGGTGGPNTGAGGGGAGGAGSDHDSDSTGGAGGLGRQIPATFRNPASVTSLGAPGPTGSVPGTNPGGDTSGKYWVAGGGAGGGAYGSPSSVGGGGGGGTIGTPYAGGGDGGPSSAPGSGALAKGGIENTGAGGGGYGGGPNPIPGGSTAHRIGGSGGSGIVIIAYPT